MIIIWDILQNTLSYPYDRKEDYGQIKDGTNDRATIFKLKN